MALSVKACKTGCYVGGGFGYGMFDQEVTYAPGGTRVGAHNDVGGRGWLGTVQVGCDFQVSSNIVLGAFADYDWSGIKGTWTNGVGFVGYGGEEKLKNSWAAGGRIGWAPWSSTQFMWFISGGYTQAQFGAINLVVLANGASQGLSIGKHRYDGWFLGTGYEYGIGFLPGLFSKTEYRFSDFGTERVQVFSDGFPTPSYFDHEKFVHTVRSELVWRFNFGGPVVARY